MTYSLTMLDLSHSTINSDTLFTCTGVIFKFSMGDATCVDLLRYFSHYALCLFCAWSRQGVW